MNASIIQSLVDEYAKTGDGDIENQILEVLDSDDYKAMPYVDRNRPFLTSSKLKDFAECPYHAKLRYIDEIPSPVEEPDYFVIGQAVDDWVTHGEKKFHEKYEEVARRTEEAEKTQLTKAQWSTVMRAIDEYVSREFFPKQPKKRNIIWIMNGMVCKAELDNFDDEKMMIGDVKTTSSITTFSPMSYAFQMAFYALGIELKWEEKVQAELYVVDKNTDFSRSHKWVFTRATLQEQYYGIEKLVQKWKDCTESGIWEHCDVDTEEGRKIAWASEYWNVCPFCKENVSPTLI